MNQFAGRAGLRMQGYGYLRGFRDLKSYNELLNKSGLTEAEKEEFIFQRHLAIASFTSNIGIDATQSGLDQYGRVLIKQGITAGNQLKVVQHNLKKCSCKKRIYCLQIKLELL